MWFLVEFFIFLVFFLIFRYTRIHATWKGSLGKVGNLQYQYNVTEKEEKIRFINRTIMIGLTGLPNYDLVLLKKRWHDRSFETERSVCKLGQDDFNQTVSVLSDDIYFCQALSTNKNLTKEILHLFQREENYACRINYIRCNLGLLWIEYEIISEMEFEETFIQLLAEQVVPLLDQMKTVLKKVELDIPNRRREPFTARAACFSAISYALAVNGILSLIIFYLIDLFSSPYIKPWLLIDMYPLVVESINWGISLLGGLIVMMIFLLGRSSRTPLVLRELLFVASWGASLSCFVGLYDINIKLDTRPPTKYVVKVLKKQQIHPQRRAAAGVDRFLELENWTKQESNITIKVPHHVYKSVNENDLVVVFQKPGYLGYRWVERVEKQK